MARKRMLDPDFWVDRRIAKLTFAERLLFLGCVSAADDEGRLIGNAAYLRSRIFPYDEITIEEVRQIRDKVAEVMPGFVLYSTEDGEEYIAFQTWGKYQKPSYAKPSSLPRPPFVPHSSEKAEEGTGDSSLIRPQDSIGKVSIGKDSNDKSKNRASNSPKKSKKKKERETTIAAFVKLYVPSPPGVEMPIRDYPSDSILDDVDLLAALWGDEAVQDAIGAAVGAGKTRVGPNYLSAILKRWHKEGKVEPRMTEREYGHYKETR